MSAMEPEATPKKNDRRKKKVKQEATENERPKSVSEKKTKRDRSKKSSKDTKRQGVSEKRKPSKKALTPGSMPDYESNNFGTDSINADLKYFRNETFTTIIREKTDCCVSTQALIYLAASIEYLASEIIIESRRNSLNNRIVPKAILRSIEDDNDLTDMFKDSIILNTLPTKEGQKLRITGDQVF